jgi:hypothetical protein
MAIELDKHPESALFILSSHPQVLRRRQLMEPDADEILEALEDLPIEEAAEEFGEHTLDVAPSLTSLAPTPTDAVYGIFQESSLPSGSSFASGSALPTSSGVYSSGLPSAMPSSSPTLEPLPSGAPFL